MCEDLFLSEDSRRTTNSGDDVVADALIQDLHLIPGLWKIDGYSRVSAAIRASFEVEDGQNFFDFPYDWRRDNRIAAQQLLRLTHDWLTAWRQHSGNSDARLILVAHSMGGLVARYFLECLEGWKITRALITFGTPFRGSLSALDMLSNGMRKGPLELIDLSPAGRSFTSIYQLLPIYSCYDNGDGTLIRVGEAVGLPEISPKNPEATLARLQNLDATGIGQTTKGKIANVDAMKVLDALVFHYEILAASAAHERQDDYREHGYRLCPIIGVKQVTAQSARWDGRTVHIEFQHQGKDFDGDGTVPRVSAEPPGREPARDAMFAATKHGSLQNADAVLNHLRGLINSFYLNLGDFLGPQPTVDSVRVALDVPDILWDHEPFMVRARPDAGPPALRAVIYAGQTAQIVRQLPMAMVGNGWQEATDPGLPAGVYRVRIVSADDRWFVEPAEDAFVVAERNST